MYKLTLKVPVYNFVCDVIIAKNIEKYINKELKRQGDEDLVDLVHGFAITTEVTNRYMLFFNEESLTVNTITHELSHLVDYVFDNRGIAKQYGDEPRAYLTGHLSEQLFDYVIKKKLLKNKWLEN